MERPWELKDLFWVLLLRLPPLNFKFSHCPVVSSSL